LAAAIDVVNVEQDAVIVPAHSLVTSRPSGPARPRGPVAAADPLAGYHMLRVLLVVICAGKHPLDTEQAQGNHASPAMHAADALA
jgi:hypothetical protein